MKQQETVLIKYKIYYKNILNTKRSKHFVQQILIVLLWGLFFEKLVQRNL